MLSSRNNLSLMWREVIYFPSWPARGLSFTIKSMAMVGSDIFWNGMASGFNGEQMVSPIWISAIPEIATIEPIPASVTSTLLRPSNSYSLPIFTLRNLSGS